MLKRRSFLKTTLLTSGLIAIGDQLFAKNNSSSGRIKHKPIVISTWNFGVSANAEAWKILKNGGKAIDAVEAGVKDAEADETNQSVGYGGLPDRDGKVTLDACIMDEEGNCGSILALENIKHAVSVARLVMDTTPHVMLAGAGAYQFAIENGFKHENLLIEKSEREWKEWLKTEKYEPIINIENKISKPVAPEKLPGNQYNHDTIGMLALDKAGNLSGACTTSGMAYKMHGRIGDSPIIGAGLFVDNEVGSATATGVGEEVIRNVGSFLVVELMRQGYSPEKACEMAVLRIVKKKAEKSRKIQVGFIAINKNGEYGAFALQPGFSYAVCTEGDEKKLISAKSFYK